MPRRPRLATGGLVFHVLNRSVGRKTIFDVDAAYAAFERVMAEAGERQPGMRLLGYCLMPNHWHLVLWPRADDDLSEYMRWLTVTHTQRWHAYRESAGTGPIYQGRFKSFPIEHDRHLLTVLRYAERNALQAGLVERAEDWRWGSLWRWINGRSAAAHRRSAPVLCDWPVDRPLNWQTIVNEGLTETERAAVKRSMVHGTPFGGDRWVRDTARRLDLHSTLRPRGRPRKTGAS